VTFATDIAALPFAPAQPEAVGLLPPIARTLGHLMFVLEHVAAERNALTEDELLAELTHARSHWDAINTNEALSFATTAELNKVGAAIRSAAREYGGWDRDNRIRNLRDLSNRIVGFTVALDRELVGSRVSDPGFNL